MEEEIAQERLNAAYAEPHWRLTRLPRWERALAPRVLVTIAAYAALFQLLAYLTRRHLWKAASGFR